MKKIFALLLAAVLVCAACAGLAEEKKTLIMATNASFPPYEYYEGEKIVGIDAEIAEAVATYLGCDFQIDDMDFGAIITAVSTGKADFGLAGMTVTEERLQQVAFSDTYASGVQVIIVKEDSDITSVDDLLADGANHVVGVQESTTGDLEVTESIEAAGKGTVQRFPNGNEAVMALSTGKLDCVVIDDGPAKAYVAATPGLKILDTAYYVENYAACIAKENTELVEQFNAALKALTEDGTIPAIIAKYTTPDDVPAE